MQALRYASYISKWRFEDFENHTRLHLDKTADPEFNFNDEYERFCRTAGVDEVRTSTLTSVSSSQGPKSERSLGVLRCGLESTT
jgi:hypothetical protein